ncbi:MAG: hypothetical protein ABF649_06695 [Bacillus sp. (in: firmicutes)]
MKILELNTIEAKNKPTKKLAESFFGTTSYTSFFLSYHSLLILYASI